MTLFALAGWVSPAPDAACKLVIVAASTPDTVNPVSDQAEVNEVPCITTDCPWQPYFFGRNGVPGEGFAWTYHFFWGLEDVIAAFLDMWDGSGVAKTVGGLFPNDADGNADQSERQLVDAVRVVEIGHGPVLLGGPGHPLLDLVLLGATPGE